MLPSFLPSLKGSTLSSPHDTRAAVEVLDPVGLLKVSKDLSHRVTAHARTRAFPLSKVGNIVASQ
jgi:hypothetical protein